MKKPPPPKPTCVVCGGAVKPWDRNQDGTYLCDGCRRATQTRAMV